MGEKSGAAVCRTLVADDSWLFWGRKYLVKHWNSARRSGRLFADHAILNPGQMVGIFAVEAGRNLEERLGLKTMYQTFGPRLQRLHAPPCLSL